MSAVSRRGISCNNCLLAVVCLQKSGKWLLEKLSKKIDQIYRIVWTTVGNLVTSWAALLNSGKFANFSSLILRQKYSNSISTFSVPRTDWISFWIWMSFIWVSSKTTTGRTKCWQCWRFTCWNRPEKRVNTCRMTNTVTCEDEIRLPQRSNVFRFMDLCGWQKTCHWQVGIELVIDKWTEKKALLHQLIRKKFFESFGGVTCLQCLLSNRRLPYDNGFDWFEFKTINSIDLNWA